MDQEQQPERQEELEEALLPIETNNDTQEGEREAGVEVGVVEEVEREEEEEEESNTNNQEIPTNHTFFTKHNVLVAIYILYTLIVSYTVSTQPKGAGWRYFSWHPFLMMTGFISMMGVSSLIKKKGGYANTKLHGMISSASVLMIFGGFYVIYQNKKSMGKKHITTTHAKFGIVTLVSCVIVMLVGGVFLHPDFGFDKTNNKIRLAHKWFARSVMLSAWVTCFLGLKSLTSDVSILALFVVPLLVLAPFTLV